MARHGGIQLTCDSCGCNVFLRSLFAPKFDADASPPTGYELPPNGWLNIPECGDLCPDCAEKIRITISSLFKNRTPEKYKTTRPSVKENI